MDIMFDKVAVGLRINQCRDAAGYTHEGLAEKIGISQQHMSNIMKGKAGPSITVLMRIAVALDISLDYLVGVDTNNGRQAADVQLDAFLRDLSVPDKQMCLALCRAYINNKPAEAPKDKQHS